jgi:hypothetical protein
MANEYDPYNANDDEARTNFEISIDGVDDSVMQEVSVREVILGESLLTPGLQTFIKVHSFMHTDIAKNFDMFKNKNISIRINRPILPANPNMLVNQRIYRIDNRKLINNQNEQFIIRACDPTQLYDLEALVSKTWKCTTPSEVVAHVLTNCVGVQYLDLESSNFPRDYSADNIHPFQVVNQQANYAIAGADDPSFVHYMTYGLNGEGIHHFRSLSSLSSQSPINSYSYDESSNAYKNVNGIMTYSFPCDFDLMSDILNGIDANGNDINSGIFFNPWMKSFSLFGTQVTGCGIGAGMIKNAITNMNSAAGQDMCPDYSSIYLLKRQGRMVLLEKDKVALRLTVPFNTNLHAGKVINIRLYNKSDKSGQTLLYGSGNYLISSMFHQLLIGGLATTTMECVSQTAGQRGIV